MALSGSTPKSYTGAGAFWVWVEWTATQDIESNTSTITAITYGGSNSYGYYNGTDKWGYNTIAGNTTSVKYTAPWAASTAKKELHRQVRTITHNDDGSKSVTISGRWTAGSNPEGSFFDISSIGTFTLDTIPRATQPSVSPTAADLGSAVTISTPRASAAFTHTLKYSIGSLTGTIATGVTTGFAWTLPESLANGITGAISGTVIVTCETYNGSSLIGTKTVQLTVNVPSTSAYWPVASITSVTEGATGLTAFSVYIQGKSKLRVISSGTGKYGATISQYKITIDGFNYYGSDITSSLIGKSGTIPIALTVTDSRGYTGTATVNVTVEAYASPIISVFNPERSPTDQGSDLSVPINFSISPLANQNTKSYQIRYRPTGGTWVVLVSSTAYYAREITHTGTGILDTTLTYEVEIAVTDYFTSVILTAPIRTAFDLLNFNATGKGIAFGKVSEYDGVEFDMPVYGPVQRRDSGGVRCVDNLATMYRENPSNTGAIVISLGTSNIMFNLSVSLRSYNFLADIDIGGYTYTSTAGWHIPQVIGNISSGQQLNIRFLANGSNRYIIIGETSTDWGGYLHVNLDKINAGYSDGSRIQATLSLVTTLPSGTVNNIIPVGGGSALSAYPVGAIYISVSDVSPATLFGGTWATFATGRTIVGYNPSDVEFNAIEKYGGHKNLQAHTHSASTDSQGSHRHNEQGYWSFAQGTYGQGRARNNITGDPVDTNPANVSTGAHTHTVTVGSTGAGNAENLMPYITVYMWKRTA